MPAAVSHAPIRDMSWMNHLFTGRIREKFTIGDYRVVAVELKPSSRSSYRYRLLFFYKSDQKPTLSINLETSILGSPCLTEQSGAKHANLGPGDAEMSFDAFLELALTHAAKVLS